MSTKSIFLCVTLPVLSMAAWTAVAAERNTSNERAKNRESRTESRAYKSAQEQARNAEHMANERGRIRRRLNIASALSLPDEGAPDPVMEAYEEGLLIDVTLEEVEAALAAAALTPDPEDDIEAKRMRHFGTYRHFCEEAAGER